MPERRVALTTIDNPYDPIDQFDEWLNYDIEMQYYTCQYLARISKVRDSMTEREANDAIERAIDTIVAVNFNGMYKKVVKN